MNTDFISDNNHGANIPDINQNTTTRETTIKRIMIRETISPEHQNCRTVWEFSRGNPLGNHCPAPAPISDFLCLPSKSEFNKNQSLPNAQRVYIILY